MLALALSLGLGGALSFWRSEVEAVERSLQPQLEGLPPVAPISSQVELLLQAGVILDDLDVSEAVKSAQGSQIQYVRFALAHPESLTAEIAYEPTLPGDPPTLRAALAALTSASAPAEALLDRIPAWDALGKERLKIASTRGQEALWDRYISLSWVFSHFEHRATCAALAGQEAARWRAIERRLQVTLVISEARTLIAYLVAANRCRALVRSILDHLADGSAPSLAQSRRLRAGLRRLERGAAPHEAFLGESLEGITQIRHDPAATAAMILDEGKSFLGPPKELRESLRARVLGRVGLDYWLVDYLRRQRELIRASELPLLQARAEMERINEQPTTALAEALSSASPKILARGLDRIAHLRCAQLALALAVGEAPPPLEDPWLGKGAPLRWERREDRTWIWSAGCDGQDDMGALPESAKGVEDPELPLIEGSYPEDFGGEDLVWALPIPNQKREGR